MYLFSILMIGAGIAFGALAVLLVHEALTVGGKPPAACLRSALHRTVSCTVLEYDRDPVFGSVVPVILFMVLPGAAALNALLGGSPVLIICYGLIALSVLGHLCLAEHDGASLIRGLLSGTGAVTVMVVLPYYAVWTLTSHMMTASPAEGALAGALIAVILYAANAGVWTFLNSTNAGAGGAAGQRFVASFLFALPVGFVFYWFGLLTLKTFGIDISVLREWRMLIGFSCAVGIMFTGIIALLDRPRTFAPVWLGAGVAILAFGAALALH